VEENENKRQEYISKFIGDLAKTIFAVGMASSFFKEFPVAIRAGCGVAFLILMLASFWLYPKKEGEEGGV
jgi:hypothetical protein